MPKIELSLLQIMLMHFMVMIPPYLAAVVAYLCIITDPLTWSKEIANQM